MNAELAALAAEAAGDRKASSEAADHLGDSGETSSTAPAPLGDAERTAYRALFGAIAEHGGNAACRYFRVTLLERQEIDTLADAMMNVAMLYDLSSLDPRAAAWLSLGMTVIGIAINRKPVIEGDAVAAAA